MEEKILKDMIERFFNAELTVEEERELCRRLRDNDVPAELRKDKDVVIALCSEPDGARMLEGAAQRLEAMLDGLDETRESVFADVPQRQTVKRKLLKIPRIAVYGAVAAAVVAFAYLLLPASETGHATEDPVAVEVAVAEEPEEDTFDTPEEAMRCFKAACGDMKLAMSTAHRNTLEIGNTIEGTFSPYNNIIKFNRQL